MASFGFGLLTGSAIAFLYLRRTVTSSSYSSSSSSASGHSSTSASSTSSSDTSTSAVTNVKKLAVDMHHLSPATMQLLEAKGTLAPQIEKRVFTVCLTGGPCSGKSSSLAAFASSLTARGLDVYSVPEVPTIIMNSGFPYPGLEGGEMLMEFEYQLFKTQLQLEDTAVTMAEARDRLSRHRPSVVFFDRGLGDMKAYMPTDMWNAVLDKFQLTENDIIGRYDLVIHLVTAADGALKYYTTANNAARTETADQALENDRRVRDAWNMHPHRAIVDNSGPSFQTKIDRATDLVLHLVEDGIAQTEIQTGASAIQLALQNLGKE